MSSYVAADFIWNFTCLLKHVSLKGDNMFMDENKSLHFVFIYCSVGFFFCSPKDWFTLNAPPFRDFYETRHCFNNLSTNFCTFFSNTEVDHALYPQTCELSRSIMCKIFVVSYEDNPSKQHILKARSWHWTSRREASFIHNSNIPYEKYQHVTLLAELWGTIGRHLWRHR